MWVVLGLIIEWGVKKSVSGPGLVRRVHGYKGEVVTDYKGMK